MTVGLLPGTAECADGLQQRVRTPACGVQEGSCGCSVEPCEHIQVARAAAADSCNSTLCRDA